MTNNDAISRIKTDMSVNALAISRDLREAMELAISALEKQAKNGEYIMPENADHRKQSGRTAPNLDDAICELRKQYERANGLDYVRDKVAYSLFMAWKVFDQEEYNKTEGENG